MKLFKHLGQVNSNMPRTFGDGCIHMSHIDAMVEGNLPLLEIHKTEPSAAEIEIGKLLASNLIDDGATLQIGKSNVEFLCRFRTSLQIRVCTSRI